MPPRQCRAHFHVRSLSAKWPTCALARSCGGGGGHLANAAQQIGGPVGGALYNSSRGGDGGDALQDGSRHLVRLLLDRRLCRRRVLLRGAAPAQRSPRHTGTHAKTPVHALPCPAPPRHFKSIPLGTERQRLQVPVFRQACGWQQQRGALW